MLTLQSTRKQTVWGCVQSQWSIFLTIVDLTTKFSPEHSIFHLYADLGILTT